MVNALASFHARAEQTPIHDMEFLLFLADTVVTDDLLLTPLDLESLELETKVDLSDGLEENTKEADEEADND